MTIGRVITVCVAAAIGAGALLTAGCSTGATREGTSYEYRVNKLVATVPHGIEAAHEATERALREDFRFEIERSEYDTVDGIVQARGANDALRTVRLTRRGDRLTEISVSVGTGPFGDEARSREIMSRIEERLETMSGASDGGEGDDGEG